MDIRVEKVQAARPIEDRRHAFSAIEEPFRTIFMSKDQGFCIIERVDTQDGAPSDYRYIVANPAFLRHTGLPDPVGKTILELVPEADTSIMDRYDQVLLSGEPERFEDYVSALDLWIEADVFPTGAPGRIAVLFSNVSDRKRAELALRAHEEEQAFLLQLSDEIRAQRDEDAIGLLLTRRLAEYLHADRSYIGKLYPEEDRAIVWPDYQRPGLGLQPVSGEYILSRFPESIRRLGAGTLVFDDAASDAGLTDADKASFQAMNMVAVLCAVVRQGNEKLLWGLVVATTTPRAWTPGEIKLVEDLAERTWAAIERTRAEDALRASEARLRALVAASSSVVYRMSADWSEMIELEGAGFIPDLQSPTDSWLGTYIDPGDAPHVKAVIAEAIAEKKPFELEHRVRVLDGTLGWTLSRAIPILDDQGEIVEWFGAASDVSERKRAEQALRASEENYRTLFESIDQGFCTIEVLFDDGGRAVDYRFLEINPAFERNTGLGDAAGKRMQELAPAHEQHWFDVYGRIALTGQPERFEAEATALGRWYNVYAFRLGEQDEHRVAILFEDITDRRRSEHMLAESEERYRTIIDEATDYAILTTDTERRIDSWSPGAQAVFGWAPDEVMGQRLDMLFVEEDREAGGPAEEFAAARATGLAPDVRWHLRKDGRRVFIDGSARARLGPDGDFHGVLKIGQDVTDRYRIEQALRESEATLALRVAAATDELRALSRRLLEVQENERRHLARELHDEIGQVLTGLQFQLATMTLDDGDRLAEAQRTVQDLTEQVRQLSMDLRPAVLDQYGLLAALRWHIERLGTRTGIMVDLRHEGLERRLPPQLEIAVFRVVQEALTNVARHADAPEAFVQLLADSQTLTLVVRDRGQGFDPDAVSASSGLGGMRERIELLGGTLTIESTAGEGTTVAAEVPLSVGLALEEEK